MTKPTKLTGLWKNTTKDGKTYLSGKTRDGKRFSVWQNEYKAADAAEGKNPCDWVLFVSED